MGDVGSKERMFAALAILGALALGVWWTMEPGKYRSLTWIFARFFRLSGDDRASAVRLYRRQTAERLAVVL